MSRGAGRVKTRAPSRDASAGGRDPGVAARRFARRSLPRDGVDREPDVGCG
jgi:hypothetical protein